MKGKTIEFMVKGAADKLGGHYRHSIRGVPHVVMDVNGKLYSFCYFGKSKIWRVFYPFSYTSADVARFPTSDRWDFSSVEEVARFFAELQGRQELEYALPR